MPFEMRLNCHYLTSSRWTLMINQVLSTIILYLRATVDWHRLLKHVTLQLWQYTIRNDMIWKNLITYFGPHKRTSTQWLNLSSSLRARPTDGVECHCWPIMDPSAHVLFSCIQYLPAGSSLISFPHLIVNASIQVTSLVIVIVSRLATHSSSVTISIILSSYCNNHQLISSGLYPVVWQ